MVVVVVIVVEKYLLERVHCEELPFHCAEKTLMLWLLWLFGHLLCNAGQYMSSLHHI